MDEDDKKEKSGKKDVKAQELIEYWAKDYTKEVFARFESYVEETEDLSVLRDLDFRNNVSQTSRETDESGEERGYKNEHVRDFYIVRLAYAYEYE